MIAYVHPWPSPEWKKIFYFPDFKGSEKINRLGLKEDSFGRYFSFSLQSIKKRNMIVPFEK
jgi:hypothetical protein